MRTKIIPIILSFTLLFNNVMPMAFSYPAKTSQSITLANKYTKIAHDAYDKKQFLKAAQYYEKAYKLNHYKLYQDNELVAYTSYVYMLLANKDYSNALDYGNKLLLMKPNDQNIKELMSEIYYSRSSDYFYTGNLDKAESDLKNSLKFSINKEQADRARDGLSKIDTAAKNGQTPVPKYEKTSNGTVPEIVGAIENKIYGSSNNSTPMLNRISKLEKDTLGKTYESDSLIDRVNRLKRTVLPDNSTLIQSNSSKDKVYDDNYISEIIQQSNGKITVFGKMPISIYIQDCEVKPYRKFYKDAVVDAFKEWEKASENRIKFNFIDEPAKADIQVSWQEQFEDFPWQPTLQKEDISAEKERMKYRQAGTLVQIGSMLVMVAGGLIGIPVIGGVGAIGSSLASPWLQYKGTKTEKLSPDIKINTKITEGMPDDVAKSKIRQIAMHQIGHAIGIFGHSPDPEDIMYQNFTAVQLSERDINTIKEIYKNKEPKK